MGIGCQRNGHWAATNRLSGRGLVQPIKELSSAAGRCAGRGCALIRQLANWYTGTGSENPIPALAAHLSCIPKRHCSNQASYAIPFRNYLYNFCLSTRHLCVGISAVSTSPHSDCFSRMLMTMDGFMAYTNALSVETSSYLKNCIRTNYVLSYLNVI